MFTELTSIHQWMRTVWGNTKYSFYIMRKHGLECDMFYLLEFERHGEIICSLNSIKEMRACEIFGQVGIPSRQQLTGASS